MLRPETENLEKVVGEIMTDDTVHSAEFLRNWQERVVLTLNVLERSLAQRYIGPVKDLAFSRYIRYHQHALMTLSDRLYKIMEGSVDIAAAVVIDALLRKFEQLIRDLTLSYDQHAGSALQATLFKRQLFLKELEHDLERLSQIKAHARLSALIAALSSSLNDLLKDPAFPLSYPELDRIRSISELTISMVSTGEPDADRLFDRLYIENINSSALAEWYQQQVLNTLTAMDSEQRRKFLAAEERRLLKTGVSPIVVFDRRRADITEQLPAWLTRLKTQHDNTWNESDPKLTRLPLELSVPQLGLFLRLCFLTGCFHEHNISAVLRFFNQHFTSKKQNNISQKSLAKAFYSAEQTTAATNRAWLQRMIDHLDKKYFPK